MHGRMAPACPTRLPNLPKVTSKLFRKPPDIGGLLLGVVESAGLAFATTVITPGTKTWPGRCSATLFICVWGSGGRVEILECWRRDRPVRPGRQASSVAKHRAVAVARWAVRPRARDPQNSGTGGPESSPPGGRESLDSPRECRRNGYPDRQAKVGDHFGHPQGV